MIAPINRFLNIGIVGILLCALSGCATVGPSNPNVLRARNTYFQGITIGTLAGAGVGALIGNQIRGRDGALAGALIGAGIGALAGATYANHVTKLRYQYASAESHVDACIAQARHVAMKTRAYNNSLRGELAVIKSEKRSLTGSIASSQQVLRRLDAEIQLQQSALANCEREGSYSPNAGYLRDEISRLRAERSELQEMINQMRRALPSSST